VWRVAGENNKGGLYIDHFSFHRDHMFTWCPLVRNMKENKSGSTLLKLTEVVYLFWLAVM
jgi:hypothetical protein